MLKMESVRSQLDSKFKQASSDFQTSVKNMNGMSMGDWLTFHQQMKKYSSATWAANQEVTLNHNLARSIINDGR